MVCLGNIPEAGTRKARRSSVDSTRPPLTHNAGGTTVWAGRKITDAPCGSTPYTRKRAEMADPVDMTTLEWAVGSLFGIGAAAMGWLAKTNSSSITELWTARNETHEAVTQVRVLVAGQPTRGEFQAMEQRLISAIAERRGYNHGNGD